MIRRKAGVGAISMIEWPVAPKMLGSVPIRRIVATTDVAAFQADAQVQPDAAGPQAFLAAGDAVG